MTKGNVQPSPVKGDVYDLNGRRLNDSECPDTDLDEALDADRLKRRWRVLALLGWFMVAVVIVMLAMVALFETPEET